ncbi:hypothetical protein [Marinactinospora rubrisoli]|uniref:Uncharacterized protein n=1 Tax=Marinactinospora rubrisoli TaxID=2715399 RepID=A0ABW2KLT3_9ACTN
MWLTITEADRGHPVRARPHADQEAKDIERYGADLEPGAKPSTADVTVFLLAGDPKPGGPVGRRARGAAGTAGDRGGTARVDPAVPAVRHRRIDRFGPSIGHPESVCSTRDPAPAGVPR